MFTIIDALNDLVTQAIIHGGDSGGPYFCNEKGLADAVNNIANVLGITWDWEEGYGGTKEYPVFTGPKEPDPSRPGPLPSNTHVITPDKCPKCGWYLVRGNDAYPPKYRLYCPNCNYERIECDDRCPELGRLDFDEFDTKRHPDCPLIDVSDEDTYYKLIKEENHYLTIMKALEKLRKEEE